MIIFEIDKQEKIILDDIIKQLGDNASVVEIDSLSGVEVVQVIVPITAAVATLSPVIIQFIKCYHESKKVNIKIGSIDISVYGVDNAIKLLEKVNKTVPQSKREK